MTYATDQYEAFQFDGHDDIDKALHLLRELKQLRAAFKAERDRLVVDADEWFIENTADLTQGIEDTERGLAAWMLSQVESDPTAPKNLSFPSGSIDTRKGSTVVEVDDEKAFVVWASEHHANLLRIPPPQPPPAPKPDKVAIKDALGRDLLAAGDGFYGRFPVTHGDTPVPGVMVVRKERTVHITLADDQ